MTRLTVYEHERLYLQPDGPLAERQLHALQRFHAGSTQRYFDLCYRGIQLTAYVGVLRLADLSLEILPKLDRSHPEPFWRDRLLDMLHVVYDLPLAVPTSAHLRTRPYDVLEVMLERYVREVTQLLHRGLIRRFRTVEENATALRGRLLFPEQLRHNAVHRQRFYTERATYDRAGVHNQLLRQALVMAEQLATHPTTSRDLRALIARFPDLPSVAVTADLFERLPEDGKTRRYRPALSIARLLLLHYHPDVAGGGREEVLALLFDMNLLWERFLEVALRRHMTGYDIIAQRRQAYWHSADHTATLQPDLLLRNKDQTIVLDAKWKVLSGGQPSAQDLRQLYVYGTHFGAERAALLLPAAMSRTREVPGANRVVGTFVRDETGGRLRQGSILYLPVGGAGEAWLREVAGAVEAWTSPVS